MKDRVIDLLLKIALNKSALAGIMSAILWGIIWALGTWLYGPPDTFFSIVLIVAFLLTWAFASVSGL